MKSKAADEEAMLLLRRMQWVIILLSPLWAYILVEVFRLANFFNINKYNGWRFDEIPCNVEVTRKLDVVVYAEYWHFPTLDAWIIFTISFFLLGSSLMLRMKFVQARQMYRFPILLFAAVILAGIFSITSLIAPKGEQIPFFTFNAISIFIVSIMFLIQGYFDSLSLRTSIYLMSPIIGAYIFGLLVGFFFYLALFRLGLLPAVAYCFS